MSGNMCCNYAQNSALKIPNLFSYRPENSFIRYGNMIFNLKTMSIYSTKAIKEKKYFQAKDSIH